MIEFAVVLTVGAFVFFLFFYIAGMEKKYILDLQGFSVQQAFHNQQLQAHSGDEIRFQSSHSNGMALSYRRVKRNPFENLSAIRYENISASKEHKAHYIVVEFPVRNQDKQHKLAQKLDELAKRFQWNFLERKLDGKILAFMGDGMVALYIEPPLYSKGLSTRLQNLLSQVVQQASAEEGI